MKRFQKFPRKPRNSEDINIFKLYAPFCGMFIPRKFPISPSKDVFQSLIIRLELLEWTA